MVPMVGLLALLSVLDCPASKSAEVDAVLDSASVIKLVRSANIVPPTTAIQAQIAGKEIIVSTYVNAHANDTDCKIDAVLLAKKIFAVSKSANDVRLIFYETDNPSGRTYRSIIVRAGDIDVFSKGEISKEALMASITVAHENRPLKTGFKFQERQDLLNQIKELQAKNADIGGKAANVEKCYCLYRLSENALSNGDHPQFLRAFNDTVVAVNQEQEKVNYVVRKLNSSSPVKGPQYERRIAIYQQLDKLEKQGKNITQLRRIFEKDIEPLARRGQDSLELQVTLLTLERALAKQ